MAKFCTNCGKELTPDAAVCPECGAPIPGAAAPKQEQPAPQTPAQAEQKPADATAELTLTPKESTYSQPSAAPAVQPSVQPNTPQSFPQQTVQQPPMQQNASPSFQQPPMQQQTVPPQNMQRPTNQQPMQQNLPPQNAQRTYNQQPMQQQQQFTQPPYGQQQFAQPIPAPIQPQTATSSDVMKTSGFFWLMFLYAIPVIGFIVCLIMAFASSNASRRNFSRAILLWILVGVIISILLTIVGLILAKANGGSFLPDLSSIFSGISIS